MKTENKKNKKSQPQKIVARKYNRFLSFAIVAITFVVYFGSLQNDFQSSWDDNTYVTDNSLIKSMHGDSIGFTIKKIFSSNVAGNYHPLTMLTYAAEYSMFGLHPKPYHFISLLLHMLNALLVFFLFRKLTKKQWTAFITAILFSIHPMHVESVAWISELKDVLYVFFYLASLYFYLKYLDKNENKLRHYVPLLLLFIAAVLSKAMAVTLPLSFFAIDYLKGRKFSRKVILEKIPFIILAILFGLIAIHVQKESSTMDDLFHYNFFDRILFSCYGIMMYLWKMIFPINLSALYSYPQKISGAYPMIFYIAPVVLLILFFLVYYSKRFGRDIIFGFSFFLITVALVSQFIPVGAAIMADRYTYLPYVGLFFIIGQVINRLAFENTPKYKSWKFPAIATVIIFSVVFSYATTERIKIWRNSFTLWDDAIRKNNTEPIVYNARGGSYYLLKQYDKAIEDFTKAIVLKNSYPSARYNRGLAYNNIAKSNEAIEDFTVAINSGQKFNKAYSDRGNSYTALKKYDMAINDYNAAIKNDPDFAQAYINRGIANGYLNKFEESITDFDSAIRLNPRFTEAYFNRGITYFRESKFEEALDDMLKAKDLGYPVANDYIETIRKELAGKK